ncbi:WhiB family transcriptional regulator [Nocardiopsis flavescens]|uniref:WhiB family transcriptional regulator n=1 Tax=Nocardiopsis flavescens TaxID=758803 RepID=UPI003665D2D7
MSVRRWFEDELRLPGVEADLWRWQDGAACSGMAMELFYGYLREPVQEREQREAVVKELCRSCPVVEQCRTWAEQTPSEWGIWGGTTDAERAATRQERRAVEQEAGVGDAAGRVAHGPLVSVAGSERRLRAAALEGWGVEEIAEVLGLSSSTLASVRSGRRRYIVVDTAEQITQILPVLLEMTPAAARAQQVAQAARKSGWHPLEAWGADIDDPDAEPWCFDGAA